MAKKILSKLSSYIVLIGGIICLQTIGYIEAAKCQEFRNRKKLYCTFIKKTKITSPSKFLYKQIINVVKLKDTLGGTLTTSGLVTYSMPEVKERFSKFNSGFNFYYPKGSRSNAGYLILAAADPLYDGEPLIELWDMNNQKLLYKWKINTKYLLEEIGINYRSNSLRLRNPLLLEDANIVVPVNDGPLIKLAPNGEILKINKDYIFHHSIEKDEQERIYVPIFFKGYKDYSGWDEGFAILDEDLNVLETYSLREIFKNAGLDYKLNYFSPSQDPFHLNDVQPLKDQVSTNIVLLSLRNQSSIIAFDIKKRNIIWVLEGYFNHQHDVDILEKEGTSISIFDNNITPNINYQKESNGNIFTIVENLPSLSKINNEEMIIFSYPEDLKIVQKINITKEKFSKLGKNLIPKTISEGNSEIIYENDSVTIEETNYGRLFEYDLKRKEVIWEYINRNDKKDLYYMMGWSRRLNVLPESVKSVLSNNNNEI